MEYKFTTQIAGNVPSLFQKFEQEREYPSFKKWHNIFQKHNSASPKAPLILCTEFGESVQLFTLLSFNTFEVDNIWTLNEDFPKHSFVFALGRWKDYFYVKKDDDGQNRVYYYNYNKKETSYVNIEDDIIQLLE